MGSYSSLSIENIEVDWQKNCLAIGGELFCNKDKKKLHKEYVLARPLKSVLPRLELEGYTLKNSRKILRRALLDDKSSITYKELEEKLAKIDFFNNGKYENIDSLIFNDTTYNLYSCYLNPLALLRIIIEVANNKDANLILDYMDLYKGGWITKDFLPKTSGKFLILTEGKTDTEILKLSLKKIFPYIFSYFSFANMEESPFGGTTHLVKFIKGLNSINYRENVIAIFDNDTAGNAAKLELPKNINNNIKTITLPKHKKFSKFNTIGVSNKKIKKNINGKGVAIECFWDLPEDACIRWISYDEKLKAYQGCFDTSNKKSYYSKFLNAINDPNALYNYEMLEFLWKEIIKTAIKMNEKLFNYDVY